MTSNTSESELLEQLLPSASDSHSDSLLLSSGSIRDEAHGAIQKLPVLPDLLAGALTRILVQLGLGRLPLGPGGLGSLLPPPQLLLEALVQIPKFAGSHHRRVALERVGIKAGLTGRNAWGQRAAGTRTRYHLVHGVAGVEALCVGAADPGRLQQLLLLSLLIPPLPLRLR